MKYIFAALAATALASCNDFLEKQPQALTPEQYLECATPWLEKALDPAKFDFKRLGELLQNRTEVFNQLPDMVRFLAEMPEFPLDFYANKTQKSTPETAKAALEFVKPVLEGITDWTEEKLHDAVMEAIPATGMKNGQVLWPMRIAISGQQSTPGGAFEVAYLLGREETLRRLNESLAKLS